MIREATGAGNHVGLMLSLCTITIAQPFANSLVKVDDELTSLVSWGNVDLHRWEAKSMVLGPDYAIRFV